MTENYVEPYQDPRSTPYRWRSNDDWRRQHRHDYRDLAKKIVKANTSGPNGTPQLVNSTVEGGAIPVRTNDGTLTGLVGVQYDGTTGVTAVNGPKPPTPTQATVTETAGGLRVAWGGTFVMDAVVPLDFSSVEIHLVPADATDPDVQDAKTGLTLYDAFTTPRGGELSFLVPPGEYFVRLVTRTTSGMASDPSFSVGPVGPNKIVGDDILEGAIAAAQIADEAITNTKLGLGAVTGIKLADFAVTGPKLADQAITNTKLGLGAVTGVNIADFAVTEEHVADFAVSTRALAAGAVTGMNIADFAVNTQQIANGAVASAKIVDGAIVNAKIGDAAITNAKIANLAVGVGKIDALAVGSAEIQAAAITQAKIADLAVGSAQIQNAAVQTAKIDLLAVGTAQIANLAVDNGKIANLAVSTAKIQDLAVSTAKIDNLAVGTAKIADLSVASGKIADLAVVTAKIADLAVNDAKIGSLSASKITAGTISANVTVSGRMATALTGQRAEMNSTGFWYYDAAGTSLVQIANGIVLLTGMYFSAPNGTRRIVMGAVSTTQDLIQFQNAAGVGQSYIRARQDTGGNDSIEMGIGSYSNVWGLDRITFTEGGANSDWSSRTLRACYQGGGSFAVYSDQGITRDANNNPTNFTLRRTRFVVNDNDILLYTPSGVQIVWFNSDGQATFTPGAAEGAKALLVQSTKYVGDSARLKYQNVAGWAVVTKMFYNNTPPIRMEVRNANDDGFEAIHAAAFTVNSDERGKKNKKRLDPKADPRDDMLAKVLGMYPTRFERIRNDDIPTREELGFIAQEMPDDVVVLRDAPDEDEGVDLMSTLTAQIQAFQQFVEETRTEIAALKGGKK